MVPIKRLVVKIGTSSLTKQDSTLDARKIEGFVKQLASARKQGIDIVIVTSGAIGAGKAALGLTTKIRDIPLRQACAAIGQPQLMQHYHRYFGKHDLCVAQLLLTYESFSNRKTYLNLENSLHALFERGIIPIINENDPVAVDEIGASFGDNDKLSALVASKIDADMLLILSDIDGLYDKNPKEHKDARLIPEVRTITQAIVGMAGKAGSAKGTGGMKTKLEAAKICSQAGVTMVIAKSTIPSTITRILDGEKIGTTFFPTTKIDHKKRWISFAKVAGSIAVDEGAKAALFSGKNLLPAGVTSIYGVFPAGEVVELVCNRQCFGRGMADFSSEELKQMVAQHAKKNVIKRENLLLFSS